MSTWDDARRSIAALRASHDHLAALVGGMSDEELRAPSYDDEWSIGQVLSHLGSQSEIFELFLDAALDGQPAPGGEVFPPIWDVWNAKAPLQWRDDWHAASEAHVARFEAIDDATAEAFSLEFFGRQLDLAAFVRMRLSEQAVHTWDIEVMGDPAAVVAADAVPLVLDDIDRVVEGTAKGDGGPYRVRVGTHAPVRDLVVEVGDPVLVRDAEPDDAYDGSVDLPAEAFLRLVYGRLDADHTPEHSQSGTHGLSDLRAVFPGV
ncbi:MAG TPA: maleylpyruvate isomerase family mycothiol-dependent enzyme [Candidatus Nanopelagicales bacterium]|nr:maleylpyruvate isomerase family mycothiol-dependent enzyme [Candidatus Nanopelagicales bacterium]